MTDKQYFGAAPANRQNHKPNTFMQNPTLKKLGLLCSLGAVLLVGDYSARAQISVGSGGLAGKGFAEGSQAQLGYLPARHTDFIFSVLAEEMGFLGVSFTLALYLFWLWRILETAQLARDRVGAFLCAAIATGFAFQVVYNSAMVAGLVPVKGLPLPLMSSGGSSVLASLISVGLVLNVRMRRFAN